MNAVIAPVSSTNTSTQSSAAHAHTLYEAAKYVEKTPEGWFAANEFAKYSAANYKNSNSQSYAASLLVQKHWDQWKLSTPGVKLSDPSTWKGLHADAQKALAVLFQGPNAAFALQHLANAKSKEEVGKYNKAIQDKLTGNNTSAPAPHAGNSGKPIVVAAPPDGVTDETYRNQSIAYVKASDEYKQAEAMYAKAGYNKNSPNYSEYKIVNYAARLLMERNFNTYKLGGPDVMMQYATKRAGVTDEGKMVLAAAFEGGPGYKGDLKDTAEHDKTNPGGRVLLKHIVAVNADTKKEPNPPALTAPAPAAPAAPTHEERLAGAKQFVELNDMGHLDGMNLTGLTKDEKLRMAAAKALQSEWNDLGIPPEGITYDKDTMSSNYPGADLRLKVLLEGQIPGGEEALFKIAGPDRILSKEELDNYIDPIAPANDANALDAAKKLLAQQFPGIDPNSSPEEYRNAVAALVGEKVSLPPDGVTNDPVTWRQATPEQRAALRVLFNSAPDSFAAIDTNSNGSVTNQEIHAFNVTNKIAKEAASETAREAQLDSKYGAMDETGTGRELADSWKYFTADPNEQKTLARPYVATQLVYDNWDRWGLHDKVQLDDPATWGNMDPNLSPEEKKVAIAALTYIKETGLYDAFDGAVNADNFVTRKDLQVFLEKASNDLDQASRSAGKKWDAPYEQNDRLIYDEDTSQATQDNYVSSTTKHDPGNLSLQMRKQALILRANHTLVAGVRVDGKGRENINQQKLDIIAGNTDLSRSLTGAARFFSEPALVAQLDSAGDNGNNLSVPDGEVSAKNLDYWTNNYIPKDSGEIMKMLPGIAMRSGTKGVDISKVGPDFFNRVIINDPRPPHNRLDDHPAAVKAAVLFDLLDKKALLEGRADLWHEGKAGENKLYPDIESVKAELNNRIAELSGDKATMEYIAANRQSAITSYVAANPALKNSIKSYIETTYNTGASLNAALNTPANGKDGPPVSTADGLRLFTTETATLDASGAGVVDATKALDASGRRNEVEAAYRNDIVNAVPLKKQIAEINNNASLSAEDKTKLQEQAVAKYTSDTAAYASVLGREFIEKDAKQIHNNGVRGSLDSISADDFAGALMKPDGKTVDPKKLDALRKTNPDLFLTPEGKPLRDDQVVKLIQGIVNLMRNGDKFLDAVNKTNKGIAEENARENLANTKQNLENPAKNVERAKWNELYAGKVVKGIVVPKLPPLPVNLPTNLPTDTPKKLNVGESYQKGYMHGAAVALGGMALAFKTMNSLGKPLTDSDKAMYVTDAVGQLTTGIDGYAKNAKFHNEKLVKDLDTKWKNAADNSPEKAALKAKLDRAKNISSGYDKFGGGAKVLGGLASGVGGIFSILDGVKMLNSNPTGGALSITSGALALVSMIAGIGEGAAAFSSTAAAGLASGMFGILGAATGALAVIVGVGVIVFQIVTDTIEKEDRGAAQDRYHKTVGELASKYDISGHQYAYFWQPDGSVERWG